MNETHRNNAILTATLPASLLATVSGIGSVRTTPGVIAELVHDSMAEILIATPFLTAGDRRIGGESLFEALVAASRRGVLVQFLFSKDGAESFRKEALRSHFPLVEIYAPDDPVADGGQLGSHAKVAIADRQRAYIGSANLTNLGMHSNLELGVLIEGIVAQDCWKLLDEAMSAGYFKRCD